MMTEAKADKLLRLYPSARVVRFNDGSEIIDAVSVSNKHMKQSQVIEFLKDETPLWPGGACNNGMGMWVQSRTWYPFKVAKKGPGTDTPTTTE